MRVLHEKNKNKIKIFTDYVISVVYGYKSRTYDLYFVTYYWLLNL